MLRGDNFVLWMNYLEFRVETFLSKTIIIFLGRSFIQFYAGFYLDWYLIKEQTCNILKIIYKGTNWYMYTGDALIVSPSFPLMTGLTREISAVPDTPHSSLYTLITRSPQQFVYSDHSPQQFVYSDQLSFDKIQCLICLLMQSSTTSYRVLLVFGIL